MEGVYPFNPANSPEEPKPGLVLMGQFALALMATLFCVYVCGKIFGDKKPQVQYNKDGNLNSDDEKQKED